MFRISIYDVLGYIQVLGFNSLIVLNSYKNKEIKYEKKNCYKSKIKRRKNVKRCRQKG